jgi:hypothetical protein
MHLHLPKPLHGWRAFAGEVGIIVLGVLIALGAEQAVQTIRAGHQLAQLRSALDGELADDRARWEEMQAEDPCTLHRLDLIERWVATAPPDARLSNAFNPQLWNMHSSAWDLAKTSSVTERVPLNDRLTYASLYSAVDNWRDLLMEERQNARQLQALLSTADLPENRRAIPDKVAMARILVAFRQRNYPYFFTRFDDLKIKADPTQLTIATPTTELCKPLQEVR